MIVHEHITRPRWHRSFECSRGDQPLKRRGTGVADLVRLDNFTGDNRKAKLDTRNNPSRFAC